MSKTLHGHHIKLKRKKEKKRKTKQACYFSKLKNQNNLLMKLPGFTRGASANSLLCYSAEQYCTPVLSRSAHASQVGVQLNSTMRLISGTLRSTPLSWLPVCSPTLNRQPYEGRLPLTSWWRKSSNMTVGQCSLIYLAHHCYD